MSPGPLEDYQKLKKQLQETEAKHDKVIKFAKDLTKKVLSIGGKAVDAAYDIVK